MSFSGETNKNEPGDTARSNKKQIKVRKPASSSATSLCVEQSDSDDYIPLAARDSKWVGLNISTSETELYRLDNLDDEVVLIDVVNDDLNSEEPPIYTLFPFLREKISKEKLKESSSTDDSMNITKMLVGQKPDFTHVKKSKLFQPVKSTLPSLEELPNEEKLEEVKMKRPITPTSSISSSSKISKSSFISVQLQKSTTKKRNEPVSSNELATESVIVEADTKKEIKKKRRRKKRSISPPPVITPGSSYSGLNIRVKRKVKMSSSHKVSDGSAADVESLN